MLVFHVPGSDEPAVHGGVKVRCAGLRGVWHVRCVRVPNARGAGIEVTEAGSDRDRIERGWGGDGYLAAGLAVRVIGEWDGGCWLVFGARRLRLFCLFGWLGWLAVLKLSLCMRCFIFFFAESKGRGKGGGQTRSTNGGRINSRSSQWVCLVKTGFMYILALPSQCQAEKGLLTPYGTSLCYLRQGSAPQYVLALVSNCLVSPRSVWKYELPTIY